MSDDEISIQFATYAEKKLDWPRRDSIVRRSVNAFVAIGYALLGIHVELRRLNEGRDQFHREVLGVLTAAKDPSGSLRSEQPAAAPVCPECGHVPAPEGEESTTLTYEQWNHHLNSWFRWRRSEGDEKAEAWRRALEEMEARFGPCPEES